MEFQFEANRREIATVISNIAFTNFNMGDCLKAKENNMESLEIYKSILEENRLEIGICYSGIGDALFCMESYKEALINYNKSLEIRIPKQGENHKRVIEIKNRISEIQNILKAKENAHTE